MSIRAMMFISLLAWASIIVCGYLYLLCIWTKNWVDRKPMPPLDNIRFAKWLHTLTGDQCNGMTYQDYAAKLHASGFIVFAALSLVALSISYLPICLIVGSIIIELGVIYTVRWIWDAKKSAHKTKESAHLYNKKEK